LEASNDARTFRFRLPAAKGIAVAVNGDNTHYGAFAAFSRFGRTYERTVMSGVLDLEILDKSAVFRHVRRRLFASVHGVSVVNLWSVLDRYEQLQNRQRSLVLRAFALHA
jgi:hypothetical protein